MVLARPEVIWPSVCSRPTSATTLSTAFCAAARSWAFAAERTAATSPCKTPRPGLAFAPDEPHPARATAMAHTTTIRRGLGTAVPPWEGCLGLERGRAGRERG